MRKKYFIVLTLSFASWSCPCLAEQEGSKGPKNSAVSDLDGLSGIQVASERPEIELT